MGANSKIEWTDATWNPVTGCTPISAACDNCYAARMAKRLAGCCGYPADDPFRVTLHPELLDEPRRWRRPRRVFVVSMGDLFHKDVPFGWATHVFDVIRDCPKHTFQILTKRPGRMEEFFNGRGGWRYGPPPDNVWLGVTVENQATADERIPMLLRCPAKVRFLSCEPLLGPVNLRLATPCDRRCNEYDYAECPGTNGPCIMQCRVEWVIAGGESGPNARPSHPDWFRSLRDQCAAAGVPYFFKQWGSWAPGNYGSKLNPAQGIYRDGRRLISDEDFQRKGEAWPRSLISHDGNFSFVTRVGKHAAGCLLDGREHKEFPT
ncbi:MAG: phage Gp37/Gp68 family protein [Planctomycetaceae bacterium]